MIKFIKNFNKYQLLLIELVKRDIKLKYRRSVLGIFWTLLQPLLTMLVLMLVFSKIFNKGIENYPVYLITGRLIFDCFSTSTKAAIKAIRSNASMIKKVYVPKYMYPLSIVLSNYITFLISLIVLVLVMVVTDVSFTWYMLLSIIPLILILVLSLGVGLLLSSLAVFFRDLEYLYSVFITLLMYLSALFYSEETLIGTGSILALRALQLNPVYAIIKNFRLVATQGEFFHIPSLGYATAFSFGVLLIGTYVFYKQQDKFILNI